MKKALILGLVLVFGLVFSLAACEEAETTTTGASTETTTAEPTEVIKIGHLRPLTGPMAATSQEMINAFDWAFEQIDYEVAGKRIEIVIGDSKADAQVAIDVAKTMVEQDGVSIVVGPIQGGELMPVAGYMNEVGVPHLSTTQVPPPVVIDDMKWTICAGGTEPMSASVMAKYAYETLNIKKVIILTGDFTPGHGFLGAFKATFEALGGEVVQEIYTPVPTQDFSPYLASLEDADAVAAWIDGDQAVKLLTQYHEFGIDEQMPIVAASWGAFIAPYILGGMPAEAADATIGKHYIPTSYSPLTEFAFNQQWVDDFRVKFGFTPEDTSAGAYLGAQCVIEALKLTDGDTDPEALREALLAVSCDSPFGPVTFDPETRVRHMDMNICQIVKEGDEYLWNPIYTFEDIPPLGF